MLKLLLQWILVVCCWSIAQNSVTGQTVRLADSKVKWSGRVEILVNGQWSTVPDTYFTTNDAKVICRMLGYGHSGIASIVSTSLFGQGTGPVVQSGLQCSGTEENITQCGNLTAQTSFHFSDVSISCVPSQVRLVDGDTHNSGRVEVFVQGQWSSICDRSFDVNDARVICSMLGYSKTGIVKAFGASAFGTGSGDIMLSSLSCKGTERDIVQCKADWGSSSNCHHRNDAGVTCGATKIRLVDGPSPQAGRVEILHAGTWGTICDSRSYFQPFDRRNAKVICNMLGYNSTYAFGYIDAFYGEGHGPVITADLDCDGSEVDIVNCPQTSVWHTLSSASPHCPHANDIGVNCNGNIQIRLKDGNTDKSGRVELFRNGHWGTVGSSHFDNHGLEVICRMLGFDYSSKSFFLPNSYYGQGLGEVIADSIQCDGGEKDIGDCHGITWWPNTGNSDHSHDLGVNCDGEIPMRVVDGPTNGTGRLEIMHNGYYGTVCDRGFDRLDLVVVCRSLGYDNIPRSAYFHAGAYFDQGLGNIVVSELACNGAEENIGKCKATWFSGSSRSTYCDHSNDVSVSCDGGFEQLRLVNGTNKYSGRVEVSHNGQWWTVCQSGFDRADAVVVCRMLGFPHPEHARAFTKSEFGQGTGSMIMSDLKCNGLESNLEQCKPTYSPSYCSYNKVAGVDCCPSCAGAPNFIVG